MHGVCPPPPPPPVLPRICRPTVNTCGEPVAPAAVTVRCPTYVPGPRPVTLTFAATLAFPVPLADEGVSHAASVAITQLRVPPSPFEIAMFCGDGLEPNSRAV